MRRGGGGTFFFAVRGVHDPDSNNLRIMTQTAIASITCHRYKLNIAYVSLYLWHVAYVRIGERHGGVRPVPRVSVLPRMHTFPLASEWGGDNLNGVQDFRTENGSSQGQNLALTGLIVPSSLDSASLLHYSRA